MNRTAPPAVELDGVTRRYGETTAVSDLSLSIQDGEFFTLVGPSGCGKTTTLRLIAGFEDPTQGEVRFGGTSATGVPPEDRDVGVVFQNYALFPHMTVGENIAYGLSFTDPPGGGSDEARVRELLELVDLGGMADRDPDTLSGGQQQRVAMARALAPGPDVLLLDEPMSALDAKLRERLRVQVREIQQELGITTIYVTHDQEEALAVSDRVAVMRDGTPEQVAPPRTIYREPATEFVATFVGDNNVLSGAVTAVRSTDDVGESGAESGQPIADVTVDGTTLVVALEGDGDPATVSSGDQLTFCVRPERLAVDADRNALTATVTSAEFLGETTRVHLDWKGRELLLRAEDPPTGTVTVGFAPTDTHIVDRQS
ncbi:ABC transporter ATP-binding protein [Haloarcula sp. Atlit-7R]|uniref:ABC transporter ATP-binding protein n=1 Tax=Haloarcula sp. Atlit-7R TaxID=2282125 RepID=UPI000EF15591|nr:ABC transporter ATP-binding protein [Haloarcula sp. Atlit-7R]RLN01501.1 ABC transporter ATP-binding protein [Haloarcula sp. Atlit-7R]